MAKWIDIGPASDVPPGKTKTCRAEGVPLAVCNVGGAMHAIADICPHAGMPLGQGDLTGKVITCPFHGYAYDVESGKNVDFPDQEPPVRTFPVRTTEAGTLEVNLQPDA